MTLATRALFTGATAAPSLGTVTALTESPHGGNSTPMHPKVVYGNGSTYIGYVNGSTGSISIAKYVHATGVTTTAALDTPSSVDDHNNPAIYIRPDGKLLTAFSEHDGAGLYTRISTSAGDISAWGTATSTGATSAGGFTYPAILAIGSTLYLFIRNKNGSGTGRLSMQSSTDDGATWSSQTIVMAGASSGDRPYWNIMGDGSTIHVMSTNRDAYGSEGAVTIGHMYFDGTSWRKSDGSVISASQPFAPSQMTTVYSGAGFVMDGLFVNGLPRFSVLKDNGDDTVTGVLYRWTGSAWASSTVYDAAYHPVDRYYGSLVTNRAYPSEMFAAINVDGQGEIRRFLTDDDGVTWHAQRWITTDSASSQMGPMAVIDAVAKLPVVWFYGGYVSQSSFTLGIRALVR